MEGQHDKNAKFEEVKEIQNASEVQSPLKFEMVNSVQESQGCKRYTIWDTIKALFAIYHIVSFCLIVVMNHFKIDITRSLFNTALKLPLAARTWCNCSTRKYISILRFPPLSHIPAVIRWPCGWCPRSRERLAIHRRTKIIRYRLFPVIIMWNKNRPF